VVRNKGIKLHVGEGNGMKKELNYFRLVFGMVVFAILATSAQVYAAKAVNGPGGHLRITGILVDFDNRTIDISGEDFDFGGPLSVVIESIGDITGSCTIFPDAPQIVCDADMFGMPLPGDYLVTVSSR